ncbi:unnamed protein product [Phytophthora fragariaefolia]|uniref:Unnamed protein product n=1 Tax=Phytophthora fragariaefolia TaxID=1490495 RepID=A0A9W7D1A0_9STRA|nr:unnamed protein product [Phytophthora fragariaefolia]
MHTIQSVMTVQALVPPSELDSADPDRGAIAPPDDPDNHVEEDESEPDAEPELLCAEVESELDKMSELESLVDESEDTDTELDDEVLEVEDETLVLADEAVAESALDEATTDDEADVVELLAAETPDIANAATSRSWITFMSTGELENELAE